MTLSTRIRNSWLLGWSSFRLILNDKTLLAFPAVTIASILIVMSLVYLIIGQNPALVLLSFFDDVNTRSNLFFLMLWYFGLAFVAVFNHVALVGAIHISMEHRDSVFKDGVGVATRHLPSILAWTFIAFSFGFIVSLLDQQKNCSKLLRKVFGAAWSVITFLTIPVLVIEKINVFSALGRANKLMAKAYGENLHPSFSLGYFFLILNSPLLLLGLITILSEPAWRGWEASIAICYLLLTFTITQTARAVLSVATYKYASTGETPPPYREEFLKEAFVPWFETAGPAAVLAEETASADAIPPQEATPTGEDPPGENNSTN